MPFLGTSAAEVLRGVEAQKKQGVTPTGYTPAQLAGFQAVSKAIGSRGIQALGASGYKGISQAAQDFYAYETGKNPEDVKVPGTEGLPGEEYESGLPESLQPGSAGSGGSGGAGAAAGGSSGPSMDMQAWIDMVTKLTNEDRAWSAAQAQKQMDFQKEMSSTAHQREIEDLKAAGLNPVLSATGGNGASTPNGAMATSDNISTRFVSDIAADAIASLGNTAVGLAHAGKTTPSILQTLGKIAGSTAINTIVRRAITKIF